MTSIIVTGAASGIGRAIALRLAKDSKQLGASPAKMVLADREPDGLKTLAEEIRAAGGEAVAVEGNLSEPATCERIIAAAEKNHKRLDLLVSNAGMFMGAPLRELSLEAWNQLLDVNTRATWLLAKAAYPLLKQSGGQVIVTSSISGLNPQPWQGAYSVSKAALTMLAEQLAIEWGEDGIRVNIVSPGMVRTPLVEAAYQNPDVKAARERFCPLGRVGTTDDIANAVLFLASPNAAYINGANIVVDGALTRSLMLQLSRAAATSDTPKKN